MTAGPGTLVDLHQAVKVRMASVAATFALLPMKANAALQPRADERSPAIIDGWLPPKASGEDRFPFLIVRPAAGFDSEPGADQVAGAVVKVIVGTYSDTDDGWMDTLLLVDAVRLSLGAAPVLEGTAFEHIGPLLWELPEEQPRPQWHAVITTNWTLPRPRRVESRNPEKE